MNGRREENRMDSLGSVVVICIENIWKLGIEDVQTLNAKSVEFYGNRRAAPLQIRTEFARSSGAGSSNGACRARGHPPWRCRTRMGPSSGLRPLRSGAPASEGPRSAKEERREMSERKGCCGNEPKGE